MWKKIGEAVLVTVVLATAQVLVEQLSRKRPKKS